MRTDLAAPLAGIVLGTCQADPVDRATYRRVMGVRYLFGAIDLGVDRMRGTLMVRRDATVVLSLLKDIRRGWPADTTARVVMDNLYIHWTPGHQPVSREP